MATSKFLIFNESLADIDTDAEYLAESQRLSGVTPGLASPKMHNKLYRQCSVMAYAIASVLVARGFNADDADPASLVDSIQRAFAFSVNGNTPNGSGAITAVRPIDAWPVGSLFLTFSNTNPATLLGGGTWVQIKGKYLLAADSGNTVDGSTTVGAMTKNVPLVAHTHSFTTSSNGGHTHSVSGTTGENGSHKHTATEKGNHYHGAMGENASQGSGSLYGYYDSHNNHYGTNGGLDKDNTIWKTSTDGAHTHPISTVSNHTHSFNATSDSNGAHTHTGTTNSSGTSASLDVRPLSIYVYMWRRTA